MARDLYSRIHEIDEPTLRSLGEVLELRGRHPQQVAIRAGYLGAIPDAAWLGRRAIDVGCGTGVVARDIARRVGPGGSVTGLDPAAVLLQLAERERARDDLVNLDFKLQDCRSLPYEDASIGIAATVTVLCHLPDRERVIGEMARVVEPGGHVLVVDGDYASNQVAHPDRALTERIVDAWRENVVDDPLLMRRILPLVEAAGLAVERVAGHVHVETGQVDEATSFIWQWALFALRQALQAGAITDAEGEGWLAGLRQLNEAGALFGSVNYVSVLARKP